MQVRHELSTHKGALHGIVTATDFPKQKIMPFILDSSRILFENIIQAYKKLDLLQCIFCHANERIVNSTVDRRVLKSLTSRQAPA